MWRNSLKKKGKNIKKGQNEELNADIWIETKTCLHFIESVKFYAAIIPLFYLTDINNKLLQTLH